MRWFLLMSYFFAQLVTIANAVNSHSDFTFGFIGTYPDLRTVANGGNVQNASGFDIGFSLSTPSGGVNPPLLSFQLEDYDPTTGAIAAWINLPTCVNGQTLYLLYGDPTIVTSQEDNPGSWNSDFKGVYHLSSVGPLPTFATEAANSDVRPPTPGSKDQEFSSGLPMVETTGQVDGGITNGGFYRDDLSPAVVFPNLPATFSAWFNTTQANGTRGTIMGWFAAGNRFISIGLNGNVADCTPNYACQVTLFTYPALSVPRSAWTYLSFSVEDGGGLIPTTMRLGSAGVFSTSSQNTLLTPAVGPTNMGIGAETAGPLLIFTGDLDELRFSTVVRSDDWAHTEYNNIFSPSTFYTIGTPIVITPAPKQPQGGGGLPILSFTRRFNEYDRCLLNDLTLYNQICRPYTCRIRPDCFLGDVRDLTDLPNGARVFNESGAIALPAADTDDHIIFQFRIPQGYDGIILGQYHDYTESMTDGNGDIAWRIKCSGRFLTDCGNMFTRIGNSQQVAPIFGGIWVEPLNLIQYLVSAPNSGSSLPLPGTGFVLAGLHGYLIPR